MFNSILQVYHKTVGKMTWTYLKTIFLPFKIFNSLTLSDWERDNNHHRWRNDSRNEDSRWTNETGLFEPQNVTNCFFKQLVFSYITRYLKRFKLLFVFNLLALKNPTNKFQLHVLNILVWVDANFKKNYFLSR